MARITVEDCIEKISNRFDLVVFAVQRGRELSAGDEPTVDRDNDKNTVVSLREIAESTVDVVELRENLIISMQKQIQEEETEDKEITSETEDNIINDVEKNADKFGMQVQEKYEDI
ncbi:MAG: DNA-directed RNA polymerase subunit omega [Alphaproteobacteria bacterium MarineAlpha9_Bin2]|nr:MAG: DNA-directed RNA polymerase subunit omega [Alphaproteobacteria bacterium MarineAlpha9_Bin2]